MADITVAYHGSVTIVRPETAAAEEWIDDHVDPNAMWWCGGLVVEPSYLGDLLMGMDADGLEVDA